MFFGKITEPFVRFGQLLDLGWLVSFERVNIDDITIRAFNGDNDHMGRVVVIPGYEAKQNRGASGVLGIACRARKEDGVSRVVINVPQRSPEERYHQIVIR